MKYTSSSTYLLTFLYFIAGLSAYPIIKYVLPWPMNLLPGDREGFPFFRTFISAPLLIFCGIILITRFKGFNQLCGYLFIIGGAVWVLLLFQSMYLKVH